MNEQQFAVRVGELAARTGQTPPPITWVEGTDKEDCIWMEPPGPVGPMFFVHHHVDEKMPIRVQDFLVAQEFVQANEGVHRQRKWVTRGSTATGLVLGFFGVLAALTVVHSLVVYLLVCMPLLFVLARVGQVAVSAGWSRWFMRRSDRRLSELLGRDHVREALEWYCDQWLRPEMAWTRPGVRWLLRGAPPTASERLRWLSRNPIRV
ncbi:hypothetical protein E0H75_27705 [Kribbella capetownensis]|uniref:Uncharacterized protein n=1 Tax=Kribbella capetownensis TaxID=1572659 RepID=A0A4R0JPG5_9ACTN|nr:hypothetical protein [Kribbella capetownensis]TCC46828.1 hypothetical protein E0H75_27705 [Kribbella capetownensis]